ncbi:hypothetical protein [Microbacterium sp. SS28]|uniref:hypothetical protein n=1 Tax=Microbacterium sp. SS28 TaxID=2919948 RepID=UPI001FAA541E|nr:hypothetical protein [Microbacterium sp. SS28]
MPVFGNYDESLTPRPSELADMDDGTISALVGHDVLVQEWLPTTGSWGFVYRGNLDDAEGLPDGIYSGESQRFYGTVIVEGGRVVSVSS